MRKPLAMVLVVGGGLFVPSVASADDQAAHEKASSAFVEARKLIEAGDCDGAVPKLRESLSYESSIGARLSIVDCIEQRDAVSAWRLLKEASVLAVMNHDARLSVVEQRATMLQTRLAVIKFTLPFASEQPGFELRVDGDIVDRYVYRDGWATSAGHHLVEASAKGQRFSGEVSGELGKEVTVNVVLKGEECKPPPAPVYMPPPAPIMVDRGATRRAAGLAVGALGLATIANGVIFGLLTLDKKHSLQSECGGTTSACVAPRNSLDPERESAKTEAAISTASFAIGGAMLLGGAVIYLTAPSANASAPKQGLRLSPRAMRGGGGAFLEGAW